MHSFQFGIIQQNEINIVETFVYQNMCCLVLSYYNCHFSVLSPCDDNPCRNGGLCVPLITTYTCKCPLGFTGKTCERRKLFAPLCF